VVRDLEDVGVHVREREEAALSAGFEVAGQQDAGFAVGDHEHGGGVIEVVRGEAGRGPEDFEKDRVEGEGVAGGSAKERALARRAKRENASMSLERPVS
jgi:hypothetical protein